MRPRRGVGVRAMKPRQIFGRPNRALFRSLFPAHSRIHTFAALVVRDGKVSNLRPFA